MIAAATFPSVLPVCGRSHPAGGPIRTVHHPYRSNALCMMDLPELALGALAATGLALGASSLRGLLDNDQASDTSTAAVGLEERLRDAAATRAQTYREVSGSSSSAEAAATPEQIERRKAVLARVV